MPRNSPPPPPPLHPPPADPWYDESGVAEQRGVEARLGGGPEVSSHMKQTSMMSEIRRSDLCSSDTRGRFLVKGRKRRFQKFKQDGNDTRVIVNVVLLKQLKFNAHRSVQGVLHRAWDCARQLGKLARTY